MKYLIITIFLKIIIGSSRYNVKEMISMLNEKAKKSSYTCPNSKITLSGCHKSEPETTTSLKKTFNSSEFVNSLQISKTKEQVTVKQPTFKTSENDETLKLRQGCEIKFDLTSTLTTVESQSFTLSQTGEPSLEENSTDTVIELSETLTVIHDSQVQVKESVDVEELVTLSSSNQKDDYDSQLRERTESTTSLVQGQPEEYNDNISAENELTIRSSEPTSHFTLRLRDKKNLKTTKNQNIENCEKPIETLQACEVKENLQPLRPDESFLGGLKCSLKDNEQEKSKNNLNTKCESTISISSNSNNLDHRLSLTKSDSIVLDETLKELCANLEKLINNQQILINDTNRVSCDLELLLTMQKISSDPLELELEDCKDEPVSDKFEDFAKSLEVRTDTSESTTRLLNDKNSNLEDANESSYAESDSQNNVSDTQQPSVDQVFTPEVSQFIQFENSTNNLNKFFETVISLSDPSTDAPSSASPEETPNQSEEDKTLTKKVSFNDAVEDTSSNGYSEIIQFQEEPSLQILSRTDSRRLSFNFRNKETSFPIGQLKEVKRGKKTSKSERSKTSCCGCLFSRRAQVPDEDEPVARLSNVREKIAKFNSMEKEANEISPRKSIGELSNENSGTGTCQNVRKTRYMVLQLEKNIGKKNDDATKEMTIFLKLFKDMKKMTLSKAITRTYTLPCSSTLDCVDLNLSSNSDTSEGSFSSVSSKESPDSKISSKKKII